MQSYGCIGVTVGQDLMYTTINLGNRGALLIGVTIETVLSATAIHLT
jgi:hypothetical protein